MSLEDIIDGEVGRKQSEGSKLFGIGPQDSAREVAADNQYQWQIVFKSILVSAVVEYGVRPEMQNYSELPRFPMIGI
jgi:hypothetical protein